jgi:thiol-disulfide isomerase/thioredoxin
LSSCLEILDFAELKKALVKNDLQPLDMLVKRTGTAYVLMITREMCSSCQEQKPLFEKLSKRNKKKYVGQIEFVRIDCSYSSERKEEAKQCMTSFHIAGFPTYIVATRNDRGKAVEIYRSLDAPAREIERNIELCFLMFDTFKERNKTAAQ